MQFVRQSKFRHVFCKSVRRENCVEDVRITKISWESPFCAVNTKFLAVIVEGAGGPFMVIPVTQTGRISKDFPVVDAHRAACLEVAWCPFNENVIASCSEDCTAKVWHIPDGGLQRTLKTPLLELLGHQKRVCSVLWHPTANNILLTAGSDSKIFLWNVGTGEALIEIAGHPDQIWSVSFSYNGSKLLTACKDKILRVIDPRSGEILRQGLGHEGMKPQRAIFLKDGRIFTTGFTKRSERMYALRSEDNIEEPINQEELDTSNGVLFPFYDPDTGLIYLCGKGDSNIRYYEVNDEPPFVHYINTYTTPEPQRGLAFMPKRGLNIDDNEIARIYKCTNKGLVENLQFFVPRKSEVFQEDLYPNTVGTMPALSADEWFAGKDADPILVPLCSEKRHAETTTEVKGALKKANILADLPPSEPAPSSRRSTVQSPPKKTEHRLSTTINNSNNSRHQDQQPQQQQQHVMVDNIVLGDDTGIVPVRRVRDEPSFTTVGGADAFFQRSAPQRPRSEFFSLRSHMEPNHQKGESPSYEELVRDVSKLKNIVRQLVGRLRALEEVVNGCSLSDLENL